MDGGQITLGTPDTSRLDVRIKYHFDCVWLVTLPAYTTGVKVFLKVLQADLVDGTNVYGFPSAVYPAAVSKAKAQPRS